MLENCARWQASLEMAYKAVCPTEFSVMIETFFVHTGSVASRHMWLQSTFQVTGVLKEWILNFI